MKQKVSLVKPQFPKSNSKASQSSTSNKKEINTLIDDYIESSKGVTIDKSMKIYFREKTFKENQPKIHVEVSDPKAKNRITVPFEIKEEKDLEPVKKIRIQIFCSPEETAKLLKGQQYGLYYYDVNRGTWKSSEKQIFVEYPKAKSIIFCITRLSKYKIKEIKEMELEEEYQNPEFSRNWDEEDQDHKYSRGGEPYYLPVGFTSTGIKIQEFPKGECVAFHGTSLKSAHSIVRNGFRRPLKVGPGHIPIERTVFEIPNFAHAIFVTPSYRYAALYSIGRVIRSKDDSNLWIPSGMFQDGKILITLLQCRVKRGTFQKIHNTLVVRRNPNWADPHYSNEEMEWRVEDPENVTAYRVLRLSISFDDFEREYRDCHW